MLVYKNKEFRNLQEQVFKNMKDIQNMMQGVVVLADFGIKVVGQVDSAIELPDPATYEGDYGDAYIVGTEEPYEYYIFTRAFEGQENPSWFDLGIFPVPGPQGPQGPQGEPGPQGPQGNPGSAGAAAGFGTISATATTLEPGSDATVTVSTSGPNTEKSIAFSFGIPKGEPGEGGSEAEWGSISGDLADQTDLVNALQAKQNASNAMTTNTEQTVSAKKTFANPVEFTTSDVTYGNGTVTTIPSTIRTDKTNSYGVQLPNTSSFEANKTLATTDQLFSGDYNDLTNKPTIPAAQVNSDWNAESGVAQILNKPTIPDVSNMVTTDTAQTISGNKTLTGSTSFGGGGAISISSSGINVYSPAALNTYGADINLSGASLKMSNSSAIKSGTGSYGLVIPTTTSWTGNKTIATTDQIPVVSYPVTDVEVNGSSVLSGTVAEIDLSGYALSSSLATVATSGSYADLTNKPTITLSNTPAATPDYVLESITIDGDVWNIAGASTDVQINGTSITNDGVANILTNTAYNASTNKIATMSDLPTVPTNVSSFTNDAGYITKSVNDLTNYTLSSALATVATSGSYNDLINKPTIPAAQVNADWTAESGVAEILHKPVLATVATSGSYNDLSNTPTIPTDTSDLTNGAGFITSSALSGYATETWVGNQGYITGIDSSDVITALGYTPGTSNFSGSYTDLTDKPTIPSVSGTNDGTNWTSITINSDTYSIPSGSGTVTDVEVNGTSVVTSGVAEIDLSGYATLAGSNSWSGTNTFNAATFNGGITLADTTNVYISGSGGRWTKYKESAIQHSIQGTGYTLTLPDATGTIALTSDIPSVPVQDVTVNGTSVVSSGTAAVSVPTSASTTVSASSETFTFTYADGTTATKTFLTAITGATTTLS